MRYTTKELSKITDIPYNTLYTYLCHYSFSKFRIPRGYMVNKSFFEILLSYLLIKNSKKKYRDKIIKLIDKIENKKEIKLCKK